MAGVTITPILTAVTDTIGKAPFWDHNLNILYFVDSLGPSVHFWHADTNHHESLKLDDENVVSFVIPCTSGGFVCGVQNKVLKVNWNQGNLVKEVLVEAKAGEETVFNDAKCDHQGRLVGGIVSVQAEQAADNAGSIYGIDKQHNLKKLDSNISIGNGLDWSTTDNKLYFTDSVARQIYVYDWDADKLEISNKKVALDFNTFSVDKGDLPDGLTIDTDGNIWTACFEGSRIINWDPRTGQILREVSMPVSQVSSLCFGGPNFEDLFVTCGNNFGQAEENPLGGSVFRVSGLGVKGYPSRPFEG